MRNDIGKKNFARKMVLTLPAIIIMIFRAKAKLCKVVRLMESIAKMWTVTSFITSDIMRMAIGMHDTLFATIKSCGLEA